MWEPLELGRDLTNFQSLSKVGTFDDSQGGAQTELVFRPLLRVVLSHTGSLYQADRPESGVIAHANGSVDMRLRKWPRYWGREGEGGL